MDGKNYNPKILCLNGSRYGHYRVICRFRGLGISYARCFGREDLVEKIEEIEKELLGELKAWYWKEHEKVKEENER